MACPFCVINSDKTKILHEGTRIRVILSNPRLMPGHILITPKRHIEKISELTEQERDELWHLLIEFQEKILRKIAPGCDIDQNYRPFIPQSSLKVDHLHFHLLPRFFEDPLYQKSQIFEKEIFTELPEQEGKEIIEKLKR